MSTSWDAQTYDRASGPQQEWASAVLERVAGRLARGATVLDFGCGTGRVTEAVVELVPDGRVLAIDASRDGRPRSRAFGGSRAGMARERAGLGPR